jgi:alginate O-acetyltransferase complex protein AlgI
MIFSSFKFLLFFLIFILSINYFPKYQKNLIIVFSLFFYLYWNPIYIFLIIYLCLITYFLIKRNINLKTALVFNFIPLIYFKYSAFILMNTNHQILNMISFTGELPLAISFVTFTTAALIIDIKLDKFKENLNFKDLTEFISYFPQLIAGPILRAKELVPKLKNNIVFNKQNIKFGLLLFLIGFIKKVFLADNISEIINPFFENPELYQSKDLIKSFLLFPLQIYFDFSGYVDMALGVSYFLGIELPINFNKPYQSYSLTEFWRRWHITLSTWFRDYLYIPLGGSKVSKIRLFFNLVFTMTIAGLWHGASFNFILWGFINGLVLSFEKFFIKNDVKSRSRLILTCFIIFNLWVLFRIESFNTTYSYFTILYSNLNEIFILENIIILFLLIFFIYLQKFEDHNLLKKATSKVNFAFLVTLTSTIILFGLTMALGSSEKFIYFQF